MVVITMDKNFELFWNYLYQRDLTDKDQIVKEALRVIRTKKYIENNQMAPTKIRKDPENLFQIMKDDIESENLGYFPGDRDFFFQLFELGKDFNILDFTFETLKNNRFGTLFSPHYLNNFIFEMIGKEQVKKILITEAEKILPDLKNIIEKYKKQEITLTTGNFLMNEIFKTSFIDYKNVKSLYVSIYKKFLIDNKFDYIFSIPAFGYKNSPEDIAYDFISSDMEGRAVENIIEYLNNQGSLCMVVPAKFTFSMGSLSRLRKWINKNFQVNFIYSLPDGTFRPYSGIKTYLLSISKQKCEKINLANLELENNKFVIKNKKEVKSEEFKQHNDWRVELIFNEDNEIIQAFKRSKVQKVKIKEIAEIFRGKSVLKKDIQPGEYKVLNISDIKEGEINYKNMITIAEDARKILRYELLPGDVVISCRGTMNKVAVFKSNNHKVIASANLIIIRPKENILGDYLKIFLESPVGSTLIKSFQRGSTIMNINPVDIKEIEIPMLDLEKQREIAEHYSEEKKIFRETTEKAHKRWNEQKLFIYNRLWK
jgi:hypothetical protein